MTDHARNEPHAHDAEKGGARASAVSDPSKDLLTVLEAAERDLAGMPDEIHIRATRDALASVRTALDIVRRTDG